MRNLRCECTHIVQCHPLLNLKVKVHEIVEKITDVNAPLRDENFSYSKFQFLGLKSCLDTNEWSIQTELMWDWDWELNQYRAEHFKLQLMWELKLDQDHIENTL